jgi:hypothetical protein
MFNFYFSAKILAIKDIRIKKAVFFIIQFHKIREVILPNLGTQKGKSKGCLQNANKMLPIPRITPDLCLILQPSLLMRLRLWQSRLPLSAKGAIQQSPTKRTLLSYYVRPLKLHCSIPKPESRVFAK